MASPSHHQEKKHALITGAGGFLGQAVVKKFLNSGYQVTGIDSPGKSAALQHPDLNLFEADLADEKSVTSVITAVTAQHRNLDAALLLAGGFQTGDINSSTASSWHNMLRTNFETAYYISRLVLQKMKGQPRGGRFILVGARPGQEVTKGLFAVDYALSKSLIFRLAEILNAEGNKDGVVASVIVPGTIDTPANRAAMPAADTSTWTPPEVIAETMLALCENPGLYWKQPVIAF